MTHTYAQAHAHAPPPPPLHTHKHTTPHHRGTLSSMSQITATILTIGYLYMRYTAFSSSHDDVIKWKHFPRIWPLVRKIHRSPVNSTHKGQWRGAMFSLICAWINRWINNLEAGDFRCHRAHYDFIVKRNDLLEDLVHGDGIYWHTIPWSGEIFHLISRSFLTIVAPIKLPYHPSNMNIIEMNDIQNCKYPFQRNHQTEFQLPPSQ